MYIILKYNIISVRQLGPINRYGAEDRQTTCIHTPAEQRSRQTFNS